MNDMKVIEDFEQTIAEFSDAKYGVAVSSCTNAIFLSLQYLRSINEIKYSIIKIPSHTFLSVPCQIKLCGLDVAFEDIPWSGLYQLYPTRVWDCATRFKKDMYVGQNALQCLSFQYRKHLKIGRGGMIITDDKDAVRWLRMARINGRHVGVTQGNELLEFCGWNMYMTPEQAARGLALFNALTSKDLPDCGSSKTYPDISTQKVFK
ncbi:unnamed protein product [marine sediment metagenome]|uniref:DegT/DnrJ/EryC1/StrS aminotransferase n=1 Tax=marine sediment metagenome TaxID=412755 RepID=X1HP01_9ZZZZ